MIQEGELVQEAWDIKKIVIGVFSVVILLGGGYVAKTMVLDTNQQKPSQKVIQSSKGTVEGAHTQNIDVVQVKDSIQEKINTLKSQVTNLNAAEVASSSPQIQKVIQDIKGLENYPKDQAKQMCQQICSTL